MIITNPIGGKVVKDIEPKKVPPGSLTDSVNGDIIGNGKFYSWTNIKGSTFLRNIIAPMAIPATANVLGAYECIGNIGGTEKPCIVLFIKDGNDSYIILYDIGANLSYTLISTNDVTSSNPLNFPASGTVDGFVFKESSDSYVYFVDYINEIRKIQLDTTLTPTVTSLALRPLSFGDSATIVDPATQLPTGGQLYSGTYQIALQYYNTTTFKSSAWGAFSLPIAIIPLNAPTVADEIIGGKTGQQTSKAIKIILNKTALNSAGYNAIRLAVIKNIVGSSLSPLVAYITAPSTDWYDIPGNIIYYGTETETVVNISEIVVEDAPLKTFKTITTKENRMFGGNAKYNDLLNYDNGSPLCSLIETIESTDYSDPYKYGEKYPLRGYFRDEVYRFGITYQDKYGNWSPPLTIDFSGHHKHDIIDVAYDIVSITYTATSAVSQLADYTTINVTGNPTINPGSPFPSYWGTAKDSLIEVQDAGGGTLGILKVISAAGGSPTSTIIVRGQPSSLVASVKIRKLRGDRCNHANTGIVDWKFPARQINDFSLFDASGKPSLLGLRIGSIINHPSWAKGVGIVRMKRKKNILWQTPHIPTGAYQAVPTPGKEVAGDDYTVDNNYFGPKIHQKGTARNIRNVYRGLYHSGFPIYAPTNYIQKADGTDSQAVPNVIFGVPPEYMYNNIGEPYEMYVHGSGHTLRIVDAVLWERKQLYNNGNNRANVYHAPSREHYYYNREGYISYYNTSNVLQWKKFYEPITSLPFFNPAVVNNNVNVEYAIAMVNGNTYYNFPSAPLGSNPHYGQIIRFGSGTEMSEQQQDESINAANTWKFGNPVINGRGLLMGISDVIEDLSYRAALYWVGSAPYKERYFPLYSPLDHTKYFSAGIYTNSTTNIIYSPFPPGPPPVSVWFDYAADLPADKAVGAAYILNIEAGLGDGRYGDPDTAQDFIFTGAYHSLTPAEISGNLPISLDIFGGDCFLSKSTIKLQNTYLEPMVYDPIEAALPCPATISQAYKMGERLNNIELLQFWVESEVNTGLQSQSDCYPENTSTADVTVYSKTYTYDYNMGYSRQNDDKVFKGKDASVPNKILYMARLLFSDQKIYGTDIEGFNRFRALNFHDLEETYGAITKLEVLPDQYIYAIQEHGIRKEPVNRDLIEAADGVMTIVGGENVIGGGGFYLDKKNGSQHIRAVANTGENIYLIDQTKRRILAFSSGSKTTIISDMHWHTYFQDNLKHNITIPEDKLLLAFDHNKLDLWVVHRGHESNPGFIALYNEGSQIAQREAMWKGRMDFGTTKTYNFVFSNQLFYILTEDTVNMTIHDMYTNPSYGNLLGSYRNSEFEMVFHAEDPRLAVRFDVMIPNSTERLDIGNFLVARETPLGNQVANNVNLYVAPRNSQYRINTLRDVLGRRLRGKYCIFRGKVINSTNNRLVSVSDVSFKVSESFRNIK